jgi:TM2 domain-containing membrane protein YozV
MQGKVLAFDFRTGVGVVSGGDGNRYQFDVAEWNNAALPKAGQSIDFNVQGESAVAVYLVAGASPSDEKSRMVAALLALFLGGLGIHKFYLGKKNAGLIMLLVSIFGAILFFIPTIVIGIIAFIEFIIYIMASDEDFEGRYISGDRAWF